MTESEDHPLRFRVSRAPGELAVVQDLLNTAAKDSGASPDLLDAVEPAQQWLASYGIAGDSPGVGDLRALREDIRGSLVARDDASTSERTTLAVASVGADVHISFDHDGLATVHPVSTGIPGLIARILLAVRDAQLAGNWRRLKLCRNPACQVAFWDSSRNTSAVWHDVRVCGNAINLRRARARRAAEA